jgi:hypothetical protein
MKLPGIRQRSGGGRLKRFTLCFDVLHQRLEELVLDQAHAMEPGYGIVDAKKNMGFN